MQPKYCTQCGQTLKGRFCTTCGKDAFETRQDQSPSTYLVDLPPLAVATSAKVNLLIPGGGESALWAAKIDAVSTSFFRFYSDGTVIGVGTTGTSSQIEKWFRRPYQNSGKYFVSGSSVKFSLTSSEGTIDYDCVMQGTSLLANVFSHINGYRSTRTFELEDRGTDALQTRQDQSQSHLTFSLLIPGTGGSAMWAAKTNNTTYYLRFSSDGTVIGGAIEMSTLSASPKSISFEDWLRAASENSGKYSINGSSVKFSLTQYTTIDYDCVMQGTSLLANCFSHSSGDRFTETYELKDHRGH